MSIENSISMVAVPDSDFFNESARRHTNLPLELIAGLHVEAEAELRRQDISTTENLAIANPLALLAKSSFTLEQLLDWQGQALLLNYFGEEKAAQLRRFGIRTIQNLLVLWRDAAPPPEVIRILCRSEDEKTVAFLGTMLRSDPFVTRLGDLQDPQRGQIAGMVLEASAAARSFAKSRNTKDNWFESLRVQAEEAYRDLAVRERLNSCNPVYFVCMGLLMAWSIAMLWRFGGTALDTLGDAIFATRPLLTATGLDAERPAGILQALPSGFSSLLICAAAISALIALSTGFFAAFLASRASFRARRFLEQSVVFGLGLALGVLS